MPKLALLRIAAPLVLAATLVGCATSLPPSVDRTASVALTDTGGTRLGRAVAAQAAAHPGRSGIDPLLRPRDAFAARAVLAAAAEKSIDVQYYIWHGDTVGNLLFEALWDAAERGVRVRMLLDDGNTKGLDPVIAALDAHPNIEVRLYNPFAQRDARLAGFLSDFTRLNRRMHNKSFTVDNQVTVVGGRNIGNEYFAAGSGVAFADLDVVVVGPAVRDVSKEFDIYWSSPSAYPAASLIEPPAADAARALKAQFIAARKAPDAEAYLDASRATELVREIIERRLAFDWVEAQVLHDDPAKTLDTGERTDVLMFPQLVRTLGRPTAALDLVSPYFVPAEDGTAALVALAKSGVAIRILTNSLAASDVSAVHAGYAKRRKDLLRAGVRLFELKPTASLDAAGKGSVGSSSAAGLHAKTFAVDRRRVFVGSFNFDPRSARLNTEMGLVLHSSALATALAETFDRTVPLIAYEAALNADGNLEWIERTASGETRHTTEPNTSLLKRLGVEFMSILPIEWLL